MKELASFRLWSIELGARRGMRALHRERHIKDFPIFDGMCGGREFVGPSRASGTPVERGRTS